MDGLAGLQLVFHGQSAHEFNLFCYSLPQLLFYFLAAVWLGLDSRFAQLCGISKFVAFFPTSFGGLC